jgi:hypothetical protein
LPQILTVTAKGEPQKSLLRLSLWPLKTIAGRIPEIDSLCRVSSSLEERSALPLSRTALFIRGFDQFTVSRKLLKED